MADSNSDCVFCKIARRETDTRIVKETDNLVVFPDVNPDALVHLLIVPKDHIRDVGEVSNEVWEEIKNTAVYIAREKGMSGFRLVHNAGDFSMIPHMHVHFLGEIAPERAL